MLEGAPMEPITIVDGVGVAFDAVVETDDAVDEVVGVMAMDADEFVDAAVAGDAVVERLRDAAVIDDGATSLPDAVVNGFDETKQ